MTGAELRTIRRALDFTQEKLAEKLGVHVVTVANWERGKHPIPYSVAIAVSTFTNEEPKIEQKEPTL